MIKNSAGALGASYFQTLYSKMPSKICLITEYPEEYSFLEKDDERSIVQNIFQKENFHSSQVIYYGVPGSGKSFEIEQIINTKIKSEKEREWRVSRVVFHPDYTNSDFVGQILPVVIP